MDFPIADSRPKQSAFEAATELGAAIHPQVLTAAFARHRKAAGIASGTLHVRRHTAATIALSEGVPLHVMAGRLGDRPETLLATYAHLLPHSDEQAAETVAAVLADKALTEPAM
jgi:integrase